MVKALVYHWGDRLIAETIAALEDDTRHERHRIRRIRWSPFIASDGCAGGRVSGFSVIDSSSSKEVWNGRLIEVATGVKKRAALSSLDIDLTRDEVLYLTLASGHRQWLEVADVRGARGELTHFFIPPQSNGFRLNDFPYIFLVNDISRGYIDRPENRSLYHTQIAIALLGGLAKAKNWPQPRKPFEKVIPAPLEQQGGSL